MRYDSREPQLNEVRILRVASAVGLLVRLNLKDRKSNKDKEILRQS